jgi:hypothetical protein
VARGPDAKIAAPVLKRSAAGTRLTTSTKSQAKRKPVRQGEAPQIVASELAGIESNEFLDRAIPLLRQAILRQMKTNKTAPRSIASATKRVRDSGTLSSLVRTLEKLNALDQSREKKGKKGKPQNDAELKEHFVRRLDQLLAAGRKGNVSEGAERG